MDWNQAYQQARQAVIEISAITSLTATASLTIAAAIIAIRTIIMD
jgi:hypothetical protein